jgi:hypothetical protein
MYILISVVIILVIAICFLVRWNLDKSEKIDMLVSYSNELIKDHKEELSIVKEQNRKLNNNNEYLKALAYGKS